MGLFLFVLTVFGASFYFYTPNKSQRNPAQFSSVELEYGETLIEGEEEIDPELDIGPSYEDTVSTPGYDYSNKADEALEKLLIKEYNRALTDKIAEIETKKAKRELAERIIERNRKEGYEVELDENFNIISAKEIEPDKEESSSNHKSQ